MMEAVSSGADHKGGFTVSLAVDHQVVEGINSGVDHNFGKERRLYTSILKSNCNSIANWMANWASSFTTLPLTILPLVAWWCIRCYLKGRLTLMTGIPPRFVLHYALERLNMTPVA